MKSIKSALSLILAIILAAGTVLPAAAAEPSESDAFTETETVSEADREVPGETAEEKQAEAQKEDETAWQSPGEDIFPEGGEDAEESEEESETEIPDIRNASSAELNENGTSRWLSNYSYVMRDGRLTLTDYHGTETDVTVPGSAYVDYEYYDRVFLAAGIWGNTVTSLSFEKGVTLPEYNYYTFTPPADTESGLESFDGTNLDVSLAIEMNDLFYGCTALKRVVLGSLDTSSLKETISMFSGCSSLTKLDLSGFDTSSVKDMSSMFWGCSSLTELDLSGFDTSSLTDMSRMFGNCSSLTELDLSSFDTSSVTEMMGVFEGCSSLTELNLSGFDTSSVTDMGWMFSGCSALTELDLSGFDTSFATDMSCMFSGCSALTELDPGSFDTSRVTSMPSMFCGCSTLTELDVSGFDTSSVTDMSGMFSGCRSLTGLNLSSFDTSRVTDMSAMFSDCRSLTELNVTSFDTASVKNMGSMFDQCESLTELDIIGFDTDSVTDMGWMFYGCRSLRSLVLFNFVTDSVTDMERMFCGCSSLILLDLDSFDFSAVTNVDGMLDFCSYRFNTSILTPIELSREIPLDISGGYYCDEEGNTYTSLPRDTKYSFRIAQNGQIAFTSHPSSVAVSPGKDAVFTAEYSGVPQLGIWQYREPGKNTWEEYRSWNADETELKTLVVPASPEWNGRAIRLVLADAWGNQFASEEAWLTVERDISACSISASEVSYVYTGKEFRPRLTVTKGQVVFEEGRDYTVTYSNNINAGTGKALVKGIGDCTGSKEFTFTISKAAQALQITAYQPTVTTGTTCRVTVSGAAGSVSYSSSHPSVATISSDGTLTAVSPGSTVITAAAAETANYLAGSVSLPITVTGTKDISLCTVTLASNSYPFTGSGIVPDVKVRDGSVTLAKGTDYTVTCSNNRNTGTASVLITGKGNYNGSVTKYFTITRIDQEMEAVISASVLKEGESAEIIVTGNKGDLVFSSSDTAVASVDAAGLVTALSAGEAVITVTAKMTMNYNKAVVQIPVTVEGIPEETGRSIEDLSYSFSNTAEAFGYTAGYKIPLSSYQIIYGENTRAEMVYAAHSKNGWSGNCAGMSAASALMTTAGGGVYPRTFRTGASLPRNLAPSDRSASLGMNLTTFIEAMHIAQYTDAFSSERKAHVVHTSAIQDGTKNLDSLYNAVKSKAESDIPTVLALVQAGGHAVLAYKTKEISAYESRIYVYDPNAPLVDRYITLYKNGGHYTQWIYDMGNYGEWGTDVSYSSISYISFTTLKSIWDNRGNIGKDEASLAFINSGNFAIYDVLGNLEAVFSGGSLSDYTGKIHRIEDELSLTGSDTQEVILSVPTKTHTIVNLDRNLSGFAVAMVDTDLGLSVETTVQEVTISVDDSCSMNGVVMDASKSDNYKVILNSSLASGYDEVVVSGSGQGDTMAISQSGTILNLSNCYISLLMVDGKQVGVSELTADATAGGSISPVGTTSVRNGEDLTYTITPDAGYTIQDVFVDSVSVGAVSTYNFTNVMADHTILATFKKAQTHLDTPEVISVTNVKDGIKTAWSKVQGAENYRIYVKANGGGWKRLTETTGTSYTWTGAESGNTYGFTVRCMNAAGTTFTSGYDNTGKSVAYIAAPSVTKLESLAGGVRITWTKSTGAALYRLYYKEGTGGWKRLTETDGTSYTWTGAQSGKTYGFTVRCMNAAGTSFTSGYDDAGKTITYVKPSEIPEVTALSAVTGGLKIDWSAYQGAGGYAVYYKTGTGAGGWKKLTNVSGTTYTWTGAVDRTIYSFTVRAMNDAGTSFVSGYDNTGMSIAYKALASIPKVTSVMNVQGGVKIAWSAFTGAGSYRIFYKESGGSWKKLADAAGTSYTWTGAVSGSFYAFTVRALNAAGTSYVSGYDNTGRSITYVAAPVITTLKKVPGGIQIAWGTCTGAGSYRIFYKENGGGWKKLEDVSGTSYTWKGAASGNTYGFTVRCMDAGSVSFVSGYDSEGRSLNF